MNSKQSKNSVQKPVNLDMINYKVDDILERIVEIKQSAITEERLKIWDMERDRKLEKVHDEMKSYNLLNDARWSSLDLAQTEKEKRSTKQYIIPIIVGAFGIIIANALSPLVVGITKSVFK